MSHHSDVQLPEPRGGPLSRWACILWALLRQRCPRCRQGQMFRNWFTMNDPCPKCGLLFQREEGYFLGAMYASYVLSAAIMVPAYFFISAWLPHLKGTGLAVGVFVLYLPLVPAVWRYSRVLWVYFDRLGSPENVSDTAYEKWRTRQKSGDDDDPLSGP